MGVSHAAYHTKDLINNNNNNNNEMDLVNVMEKREMGQAAGWLAAGEQQSRIRERERSELSGSAVVIQSSMTASHRVSMYDSGNG